MVPVVIRTRIGVSDPHGLGESRETPGHREPVDVGEDDIEKHDIRPKATDDVERGRPVTSFANDPQAVRLA
jgi:hypothetical protein